METATEIASAAAKAAIKATATKATATRLPADTQAEQLSCPLGPSHKPSFQKVAAIKHCQVPPSVMEFPVEGFSRSLVWPG